MMFSRVVSKKSECFGFVLGSYMRTLLIQVQTVADAVNLLPLENFTSNFSHLI